MGFIKIKFSDSDEETSKPKKRKQESSDNGFVLDWVTELGFEESPFQDIIIKPVNKVITGYKEEREKINLFFIDAKKFGIIYGHPGMGKSTLIEWIDEHLESFPDKVLVYKFQGDILKKDNEMMNSMINPLLSGFQKTFKKLDKSTDIDLKVDLIKKKYGDKRIMILIDDVEAITKTNLNYMNRLYEAMNLQIIMTTSKSKAAIPGWEDDLDINLEGIPHEKINSFVKRRIEFYGGEDIYPFTESLLRTINREANGNPRDILVLCKKYAIQLAVRKRSDPEKLKKDRILDDIELDKEELEKAIPDAEDTEEDAPKKSDYKIKAICQENDCIIVNEESRKNDDDYVITKVDN